MTKELRIDNDEATKEMLQNEEYKYGFVTDIEQDIFPKGLDEKVIHHISEKKDEPKWLLDFRLKAYKRWLKMKEPIWPNLEIKPSSTNCEIFSSKNPSFP